MILTGKKADGITSQAIHTHTHTLLAVSQLKLSRNLDIHTLPLNTHQEPLNDINGKAFTSETHVEVSLKKTRQTRQYIRRSLIGRYLPFLNCDCTLSIRAEGTLLMSWGSVLHDAVCLFFSFTGLTYLEKMHSNVLNDSVAYSLHPIAMFYNKKRQRSELSTETFMYCHN